MPKKSSLRIPNNQFMEMDLLHDIPETSSRCSSPIHPRQRIEIIRQVHFIRPILSKSVKIPKSAKRIKPTKQVKRRKTQKTSSIQQTLKKFGITF